MGRYRQELMRTVGGPLALHDVLLPCFGSYAIASRAHLKREGEEGSERCGPYQHMLLCFGCMPVAWHPLCMQRLCPFLLVLEFFKIFYVMTCILLGNARDPDFTGTVTEERTNFTNTVMVLNGTVCIFRFE